MNESEGNIFWAGDKQIADYGTWLSWHGPGTDSVGGTAFLSSRLIQLENFATEESKDALTDAILASGGGLFNHVAGKGVIEGDPNGETSVTPAWRQAVTHYVLTNAEAFPTAETKEDFSHTM